MQPLYEVTVTRPWHWGIAIVCTPGAEVPDALDQSLVTATPEAIVIKVRHAQDVDIDVFEGDGDWATATVLVRSLTELEDTVERVIYEGLLRLTNGRLVIGDADSEVTLNDLDVLTRVRVLTTDESGSGATDIRIDLAPQAQ
jgi:hypothetical protein